MERIVILGGGVGGTLVANLVSRKLKQRIDDGHASVTVVDAEGTHVYQPGFMYVAMGNEKAESLRKPERSLLDRRVDLVVGAVVEIDEEASVVRLADGTVLPYDELVLATGARILPETIEHFEQEAHHFYSAEAAERLRAALDAFDGGKVVVGIASMPYKCPPAPLEVAFLIEAELRDRGLREKSEVHFCSPIGRAFTIESVSDMATPELEKKDIELHTFFNVESIDPERKVVESLEGEELPYDLLVLVPPHKGAQVLIDSGLAPAPGGWLPTDPATLTVGGRRTSGPSAMRPTCRYRRPARRPTSKHRSWPSGSLLWSRAVSRSVTTASTRVGSCASSRSVTAKARCCASTTSTHPSRRRPAACGTWARSRSTRRTSIPSHADASERRLKPARPGAAGPTVVPRRGRPSGARGVVRSSPR